jgi:bifunctional UDP-N-acetylglucosamine pyrophosphorylase/glucosamine-1-phosphate N-acetyltransferase
MNSASPKVLVPVNGRPMIEHLLNSIVMSGIDPKPLIVVSPENQDLVKQTLHSYQAEYVVQAEHLGTAHAVSCALGAINEDCKKVLVFNGDHPFVKIGTIAKLADSDAEVVMLTTMVEDYEGWQVLFKQWGRIIRSEKGVERIVEFKDANNEELLIKEVNPAMYAFNFPWLKENIDKPKDNNKQKEFYLTDLIGLAFEQGIEVADLPVEPLEVVGINSHEELEIAEGLNKFGFPPSRE